MPIVNASFDQFNAHGRSTGIQPGNGGAHSHATYPAGVPPPLWYRQVDFLKGNVALVDCFPPPDSRPAATVRFQLNASFITPSSESSKHFHLIQIVTFTHVNGSFIVRSDNLFENLTICFLYFAINTQFGEKNNRQYNPHFLI
ncbi:unnamed protein product [Protopolystoma xenopodis]|uniref:Uncharacterized protein n=1 Tax=Protopolystoma xenopodis TaxID=117903 RepID=A0A448WG76_9PLAT|nr:unnamed protein product [Protopolystoma xenopodis]